jgi:hypothetical protein
MWLVVAPGSLAAALGDDPAAGAQHLPGRRLGEVWLGVHVDEAPYEGLAAVEALDPVIGRVDVVHWFQAWGGGRAAFEPAWAESVLASGRAPLITWEPWALTGEAWQPAYSLASIASGAHDDYVRSWARGLRALGGGPVYLRPMHEMNGDWYPWSGGVPGGSPEAYVAAWRHLRAVFDSEGVSNVRWVWCPLADDVAGVDRFEAFYPGDAFVDVLCLDGYNWGSSFPQYGGWREPDAIFADAYRRLTRLGPQPVWLGEVGSAPEGGDKAAWVASLLASDRYPRVDAVVWFNLDKERDWRITADPAVAQAVRHARTPRGGPPPTGSACPAPAPRSGSEVVGAGLSKAGWLWLAHRDGSVSPAGMASFLGDVANVALNGPLVAMAPTPDRAGYWLLGRDGGVFSFGTAAFRGSTGAMRLNQPVVSFAADPRGKGYWFVAADGGVFAFGSPFLGSAAGLPLVQPIVAMAPTVTGKGYWLVGRDGGVFAYGDAQFSGSTGDRRLNQPVIDIAADPDGRGYWMVAADGGVFAFDAAFFGSAAGSLGAGDRAVAVVAPPTGGYCVVTAGGVVLAFGPAARP